jgi:hypothetical protein
VIFTLFKTISIACMLLALTTLCHATSSTDAGLLPNVKKMTPQSYQAKVNTNDCTAPIQSSPYVIIAGNGGANMNLTCPPHHPVMYHWQQEIGFGGLGAVSMGGGNARITCCALTHVWQPTA